MSAHVSGGGFVFVSFTNCLFIVPPSDNRGKVLAKTMPVV